MSGKKNFNEEMVFQSFYKNHIFESNKDQNKICQNEIVEFSFKKNLFLPKSDDYNSHNSNNYVSSFNEQGANIYSKNDKNIQVSGHFGKSKYDSKKYKNTLNKIGEIKQPLFYIEEKYSRTIEEEPKSKDANTLKNNRSTSVLFNNKLKKIEIKKKKNDKNNSINNYKNLNVKKGSFSSLRNKKIEQRYLYKKKIPNNNIKLNNSKISRNSSYQRNSNNAFNKSVETINLNEAVYNNKNEITNYCTKNNNQYKKLNINTDKNIKHKENRLTNNNSYLKIKNLKENKENVSNNNLKSHTFLHYENMKNILTNNNLYCPNFREIKYININSDRTYKNTYLKNKSSNKNIKNNSDKLKSEYRIKNNKINRLDSSAYNLGIIIRNKNMKDGIGNKMKNNNNTIINTSNYSNSKMNLINNKSIRLFKTRTHRSRLEMKKISNIQGKKVPTPDKKTILHKKPNPNTFENHSKKL